jgi:hypothetical protein
MKINKHVERKCRERMNECSDENIRYIMNSLYLDYPIDGPYTALTEFIPGSKAVCEDHSRRKLFTTVFEGAYGPAGVVYSIEGSPPRGIVMVNSFAVTFYNLFRENKPVTIQGFESNYVYKFKVALARYFSNCFETLHGRHRIKDL